MSGTECLTDNNLTYRDKIQAIINEPHWNWSATWWQPGCVIVKTTTRTWEQKSPKDFIPPGLECLGCSGHGQDGQLHWIGFDLDVGHGVTCYAMTEAALTDAYKIRATLGEADIRLSKSGRGIHVRHLLPIDSGLVQANAARIVKYLNAKLGLKSDPSNLGRQAFWLWSANPADHAFESIAEQTKPVLDLADIIVEALAADAGTVAPEPREFRAGESDDSNEAAALQAWTPGSFEGRSPLGARNLADVRHFVNDWGCSIDMAVKHVNDRGGNACTSHSQWERLMRYCRYPRGWALRKAAKAEDVADTAQAAMAAPPVSSELPDCPSGDEIIRMCQGTIYGEAINEVLRIAPRAYPLLPLAALLPVMSSLLCRRLRIGASEQAPRQRMRLNSYVMLIADTTSGKGTSSKLAMLAAKDLGLRDLDRGSSKVLIQDLGPNPWGYLYVDEMSPYLNRKDWRFECLNKLVSLNDANTVSESTHKTGRLRVENATPSTLCELQRAMFRLCPDLTLLLAQGFLHRQAIAMDPSVRPPTVRPDDREPEEPNAVPLTDAMRAFFAWLPTPMCPGPEQEEEIDDPHSRGLIPRKLKRKLGVFEHPVPNAFLQMEETPFLLCRYDVDSSLEPAIYRLRKLRPLVAIGFSRVESLERGVIPREALERADRILLCFLHGFIRTRRLIDADGGQSSKMAEWLASRCKGTKEPVLKSVLRNRTLNDVKRIQEWDDRFEIAVARGEIKLIKKTHPGNKKPVEYVLPGDGEKFAPRLPELQRLPVTLIPSVPQYTEKRPHASSTPDSDSEELTGRTEEFGDL